MENQKKVAIVLSTYNGEKYLEEQLRSLEAQTYENITVYIHDDGSTDRTEEITRSFIEQAGKKKYVILDDEKGLRYPACFIKTLTEIPVADYYAFCDQDDVWYPDKIEKAVEGIEKLDAEKPALFYSAVRYCDGDLNYVRSARFVEKENTVFQYGLQKLLFGGEAMGMTFLINGKVRECLKKAYDAGYRDLKDIFIKILCASYGNVTYSTVPGADYRRHSEAKTATLNPSNKLKRYFGVLGSLFFGKEVFGNIRLALDYIKEAGTEEMTSEAKELITLFTAKKSIAKQIKKTFRGKRYRLRIPDEIGYRVAFLLWKF